MRKLIMTLIVLLIITFFTLGGFVYYIFYGADYSEQYTGSGKVLPNPVQSLTDEQASQKFDESFVYYLLVNMKAYNLHNPPFSSDTPKIEINVGEDVYNAEIVQGSINVAKGSAEKEDIRIWTTKAEAVKMLRDKNEVKNSFSSGNSQIELVASKTTLGLKGYLSLYNQFK